MSDPAVKNQEDFSCGHKWALYCILIVVAATAVGAYQSVLNIGFLLDDFAHLDCACRAVHGDLSGLASAFSGNWTGTTDNLTSYRPFISLSFCLDCLVWQLNSWGYHLSNLVMFAGCSVLTSLLTFELSAPLARPKLRLAMTLISGLLFALYPIHPEAVAWIVGRVSVQCALFYFASFYTWLVFRRNGRWWQLLLSLLFFACALPSKEEAVTLPAIVLLAEFLLPGKALGWKQLRSGKSAAYLGAFWLLLIVFAVLRTSLLGTVIGGYGGSSLKELIHSFSNFLDGSTWGKVFCGVNEEVPLAEAFAPVAQAALTCLAGLAILRLFESLSYWRILLFLLAWVLIAELPAFQIWHIFPNLCGSRLLFIGSAPLCAALTVVALPGFAYSSRRMEAGVRAFLLQVAGALLLAITGALWGCALSTNLVPWTNAGNQMKKLTEQVRYLASQTPSGKVTLLLDLPQDVSGAGLLGRPEFLERILCPPLDAVPESQKLLSAEPPFAGSHEFADPHLVLRLLSDPAVSKTYKWNRASACYFDWQHPAGVGQFDSSFSKAHPQPGNSLIHWLPPGRLDPLQVQIVEVELKPGVDPVRVAPQIQLVWRSENQENSWIDYSPGPSGQVMDGKIVFVPGRYRSWLYQGAIVQVGIKFEPVATGTIAAIRGGSDRLYIPRAQVQRLADAGSHKEPGASLETSTELSPETSTELSPETSTELSPETSTELSPETSTELSPEKIGQAAPGDSTVLDVVRQEKVSLTYDCSAVSGARYALVVVGKSGFALPEQVSCGRPGAKKLMVNQTLVEASSRWTLPPQVTAGRGLHQIAVLALDGNDQPVGFFSEPLYVRVK